MHISQSSIAILIVHKVPFAIYLLNGFMILLKVKMLQTQKSKHICQENCWLSKDHGVLLCVFLKAYIKSKHTAKIVVSFWLLCVFLKAYF